MFCCQLTDVPEATVRLGSSLDPENIREGTDVYFDCIITAHPIVYKVEWRHNVGWRTIFSSLFHIHITPSTRRYESQPEKGFFSLIFHDVFFSLYSFFSHSYICEYHTYVMPLLLFWNHLHRLKKIYRVVCYHIISLWVL